MSRGSRLTPPRVPSGKVTLEAPPELQEKEGAGGLMTSLLPMVGSLGAVVMVVTMNPNGRGFLMGGVFLLSALGFVAANGWRQRSQRNAEVLTARREYLAYLGELRETVRTAADQQRRHGNWVSPDPSTLTFLVEEGARVWERSSTDDDFLLSRIGTSDQPLCLALEAPPLPSLASLDPVAASAAHRLMLTHEMQKDLPAGITLTDYARVEVVGNDEDAIRSLVRAMTVGVATFHAPDDVLIAVVTNPAYADQWEWMKWLPHVASPRVRDKVGAARMIVSSFDELRELLPADISDAPRFAPDVRQPRHVIVLVDGVPIPHNEPLIGSDPLAGFTVLEMPATWDTLEDPRRMRIAFSSTGKERGVELVRVRARAEFVAPDAMSLAEAEATARRLLPLYSAEPAAAGDDQRIVGQAELTDLLRMPDVREIDFDKAWARRPKRDRLRVPIGQTTEGAPIYLDLKEAAEQGMGPHGVLIGATGSGKSEVLRTLLLSLVLTHSPEQLNLVLVDFKGGATFSGMSDMPHVSAVITNLGSEVGLVDRFQDALTGEVVRRQELLRAAGNFANVNDYEKARRNGRTDLAPLPALLIIADEFSELLAAKPEFVESFINIGRVGRSLQIHLLLASQRLEEGKLRGLDTYLSYRIGLRTFSAAESRTVLGVPDAYTLPQEPGVGYLKSDTETMTQFRAAYVSGPPKTVMKHGKQEDEVVRDYSRDVALFTAGAQPLDIDEDSESGPVVVQGPTEERATIDIAVSMMAGRGPLAHKVWLPPLKVPATLDHLMSDLAVDPALGLISPTWRARGSLTVPLGIVDIPLEQRREQLTVSLAGAGGNMLIVGGPLSGKSTLLRTMVASLSLTATPLEVQFYVLDFGGGSFIGLRDMPHVSGVAMRTEEEAVRRVVAEVEGVLNAREIYFRDNGIDSMDTYRRRRAEGKVDDGFGDVFLIVDGWGTLRSEFEILEQRIQGIAARGLGFGVHIIVTANRWMEIRAALKDSIQTRIELRLGDPTDSEIDRKIAVNVPANAPGHALTSTKLHALTALPRIDGDQRPETLADGIENLVARMSEAWQGQRGPKLRLLPTMISLDEVRALTSPDDPRILLGVEETALSPFGLDLRNESHLFLYGDSGSGKSSFLRGVAHEIMHQYTPDQAKIFMIDYRRANLGEVPPEYLGAYLTSHDMATSGMQELAAFFQSRMPGPNVTPEELRNRSWWKGAEGFILIDDYDLVSTSQGNPAAVLQGLLAQASDLGLHVVVARRSGGASRASFDPILQRFTDLGVTGILLSGSPEEGGLIGRVKPVPSEPGRAQVVSRDAGHFAAQLAYVPGQNG
ncbi:type VII secretion protein EccCa [Microbacterium sp. NC79]|uniref:type VII secretion protein EccCa n=1 Tax=Microbacterium sp. NC79 TaxID=2851009 RepID=UPI001C2C7A77|nr:type VII secretion protein EccCa [Microbacterium sp. NC79]MBV0894039.1 type VII secretion protein EccCa [Microbacterium sp. NC79]